MKALSILILFVWGLHGGFAQYILLGCLLAVCCGLARELWEGEHS